MTDSLWRSSATYDEVMYLQVAARWWRTGEQTRITRAGSPLTFWKLQQVPVLWTLDRLGYGAWIDDPDRATKPSCCRWHGPRPLWIWLAAFGAGRLLEPSAVRAPRDGAGGVVVRAEPEPAGPRAARDDGDPDPGDDDRDGAPLLGVPPDRQTAAPSSPAPSLGGLAFSCKFTAVLVPPIFALLWLIRPLDGRRSQAGAAGADRGRGHGRVHGDHGPLRRDRHGGAPCCRSAAAPATIPASTASSARSWAGVSGG